VATIREVAGSDANVDYDDHEETVGIEVTDEGGALVATATYDGDGMTFENETVCSEVEVTKTVPAALGFNGVFGVDVALLGVESYRRPPETRYSHTANISDEGIATGTYANNLATKDVVHIDDAESLHVTLTYGTESSWDMVYVFQGEYTGSVTRNMSAGQLKTYTGGNNTTTTVEFDVPGDTVTFAFYSDGSGRYWGYHATVVG
jgi:pilin isopeptide linkage protein